MQIHWYQLLFQIVNFTILVFVMKKFLYKPIITIISQRNKKIEDSIKAAETTLKEKAKIEALKKAAIAEAEKEAVKIVESAKAQSSTNTKKMLDKAKEQAAEEVNKQFKLLSNKLADQEKAVTSKISHLVIKTTSKILEDSLTQKEQKKIIDAEINKLKDLK